MYLQHTLWHTRVQGCLAHSIARRMSREWIMRFEASKRIRSDQECNFKGKMIQEICKIYGISKSRTSRTIQRITVNMNASIEPCITFPLKKKREWQEFLPELVFAYNCTPHSTTGYSPYYLFFSREDPKHYVIFGDSRVSVAIIEHS